MNSIKRKWFAYEILPIDYGWDYLLSVQDHYCHMARDVLRGERLADDLVRFANDFKNAQKLAEETGWYGDYENGPSMFSIPTPFGITSGFVWKQNKSGRTFVVSPVAIPYEDHEIIELVSAEF